ncbi:uncharacterized protein K460DRAFT_26473 [Cucurbitaria berberidis CBS 394.84]|uniref:Uncharacterized protein n=1 Tax=Cucurbitaria berberidis CBS 394.84 TaxID=1168544 RepID=A0A9P4GQU8_9PLEO|nr:uncharacterized protein K460DRAFT_26473 [Cucurbitaria berberidis CBS 394.84]KAF1851028.1 hypothetical protein K460DRAFT_26473 [Cucurbitaria berberidis CBS 394.84]
MGDRRGTPSASVYSLSPLAHVGVHLLLQSLSISRCWCMYQICLMNSDAYHEEYPSVSSVMEPLLTIPSRYLRSVCKYLGLGCSNVRTRKLQPPHTSLQTSQAQYHGHKGMNALVCIYTTMRPRAIVWCSHVCYTPRRRGYPRGKTPASPANWPTIFSW